MLDPNVKQQFAREPSHQLIWHPVVDRAFFKFDLANMAIAKHRRRFMSVTKVCCALGVIDIVKLLEHRVIL